MHRIDAGRAGDRAHLPLAHPIGSGNPAGQPTFRPMGAKADASRRRRPRHASLRGRHRPRSRARQRNPGTVVGPSSRRKQARRTLPAGMRSSRFQPRIPAYANSRSRRSRCPFPCPIHRRCSGNPRSHAGSGGVPNALSTGTRPSPRTHDPGCCDGGCRLATIARQWTPEGNVGHDFVGHAFHFRSHLLSPGVGLARSGEGCSERASRALSSCGFARWP